MKPITLTACIIAGAMSATAGAASDFPSKPIKLIVPFSPGGPTDTVCRIIANKLSSVLSQAVVVDNRDGAGGAIGARAAASSPPDGYTLFCASTSTLAILPALKSNLGYDPVKSFTPIALTGSSPLVMVVSNKRQFKTAAELIAFGKANSGTLNYGSAGVGTPPHLAAELFKSITGLNITHIPYKGAGPAFNDLMAGQIDVLFAATSIMSTADKNRVTPLLVTAPARSKSVSDIPSAAEAGLPNLSFSSWNGVVAPSGTPQPVIDVLNRAVNQTITDPAVRRDLEKQGYEVEALDAAQFQAFVRTEFEKMTAIVKRLDASVRD
ncbi:MAG: tripartite tricarboxylate transporter substrate binding protein [Pigmentiphaga sp.]|uniref:Bug family tripartite tricarboxylate transporter substrate binding protein n=1 Tax=Pigmentiphaga sp. TaxID=1977564 RepID=UPI0029B3B419|nr:tripartite tricarboxylate transporter substrate binding protein [Pigmentiphaga sp.]MDX3907284.1 tripartite tricarboxylate transporter substrate binding protein [Pigmentiphaga sp.]